MTFSMDRSTIFVYLNFGLFDKSKLTKWHEIDAVLDSLVEPIDKTITHKPKQDAVKQEVDRNEDMIRSALRAIASISRIGFSLSSSLPLSHSLTHTHRGSLIFYNQYWFHCNSICFCRCYY